MDSVVEDSHLSESVQANFQVSRSLSPRDIIRASTMRAWALEV